MSFRFRCRRRKYTLYICVIFLVSLTVWMLRSPKIKVQFQKTNSNVDQDSLLQTEDKRILEEVPPKQEYRCKPTPSAVTQYSVQFYKKASNKNNKTLALGMEERKILEHLLFTQDAPWEPNPAAVAYYRAELGQCCNASFWLAVTKANAPLGSNIIFDGDEGQKLPVNAHLFDLLPESSPFSESQYQRCAVVGNSGILKNSRCGDKIDQADLIVRFNLPPMNFSEDVGTKTSLVTMNPSILQNKYKNLQAQRKPFADALLPYRDALFLIPTFSFAGQSDLGYRALYTMEDFGLMQQAFFLNPRYLSTLSDYWKEAGLKPRRLSSGFMFISMALEFCEHITLYGFWPFPHDLADQPIPHHYYDNVLPKAGIHAMPCEFSHYLGMYAKGALQLQLGKCQ